MSFGGYFFVGAKKMRKKADTVLTKKISKKVCGIFL